ncbi:C-terminal binding protein [Pseudaminobacter arsenicus]|uniref:C-terminal binding protein n=1 Tax=Borborobacter arsenicus TaxID=1851146 RepID=A0A432VBN0_9HYPH|nr:C-terminal binding protein [Pseudaminobacter arsenicus]RUM99503.1 C-terminal binding protein [Pseudaminobacter arsenicus]
MTSKAKVVITDHIGAGNDVERGILSDLAELVVLDTAIPEAFLNDAADCDGLINLLAGPITSETMAAMPRCKIIARYGIGVDTIDLEAATRAGIIVTNNPAYCLEEVAEHAVGLMLAAVRKVPLYDRQVRAAGWNGMAGAPVLRLAGKTLGLVGFGNIARLVAKRATAFDMRVVFFDPFVDNDASGQAEKCHLDELLEQSDVISVHVPLTAGTRGLIGDDAFARMKPSAFLLNVSRGPIVDTMALVRALDHGAIAGCALDTTDPEPLPQAHPLYGRDNVVLTPHVAWYSEESKRDLQSGAPSQVRRVLEGVWPANVVNPAVRGVNRAGIR